MHLLLQLLLALLLLMVIAVQLLFARQLQVTPVRQWLFPCHLLCATHHLRYTQLLLCLLVLRSLLVLLTLLVSLLTLQAPAAFSSRHLHVTGM